MRGHRAGGTSLEFFMQGPVVYLVARAGLATWVPVQSLVGWCPCRTWFWLLGATWVPVRSLVGLLGFASAGYFAELG